MVGARAPRDGASILPELAWWTGGQGGRARAWGGCKGFGSGGVSGRNGANFAYKKKKNGVF